ncbi:hypothetical protein DTO271G3_8633 [Paecilomyces variotii]|nr:hypothetical protein DTO271G3_8633 [Paecilomyces variotii]
MRMPESPLRIGIIGVGNLAQTTIIPTLQSLKHQYTLTSICDIDPQTLNFVQTNHKIPKATTIPHELIDDPDLDLIFILTPDEYHETYTVATLQAGKHVFVETPLTFSIQSAQRILAAERETETVMGNGKRVFVGYARRFAPSYVEAFKREVDTIERIMHVRCWDFVGQIYYTRRAAAAAAAASSSSSTLATGPELPQREEEGVVDLFHTLLQETFIYQDVTPERISMCRFLCSLGCHDLSLIREIFGLPDAVVGVTVNDPFYSALLYYHDNHEQIFPVVYESGVDSIPRQDACLVVHGTNKTVSIEYKSPDLVQVVVDEVKNDGQVRKREVVSSGTEQDAYVEELKALYASVVDGTPVKTSVQDAIKDLRVARMIFEQHDRQCGTIRTPLG